MTDARDSEAPISLILIYQAISRGLEVDIRYTETFARERYPDAATGAEFALYLQMLAGTLHVHHSAEDQIAFPFLRPRLPDLPFDALTAEHEQMTAIEVSAFTFQAEGEQVVDKGKYMVIWRREEGQWKLHRDIFNSSLPAPG